MFKEFLALFESQVTATDESSQHTVELATAALLSEIMRADEQFEAQEMEEYRRILSSHFELSAQELDALIASGQHSAEQAADLVQFTRVLNTHCNAHEKQQMVLALWRLAYADDRLDPLEEHMIRRIADLLHVSHSRFIQTKLAVQQERQKAADNKKP